VEIRVSGSVGYNAIKMALYAWIKTDKQRINEYTPPGTLFYPSNLRFV